MYKRQTQNAPDEQPRLHRAELAEHSMSNLGIGVALFGEGLKAGLSERIEPRAHSCKQRTQTDTTDDGGSQLYTWNVQDLVSFQSTEDPNRLQ